MAVVERQDHWRLKARVILRPDAWMAAARLEFPDVW
jgi:hypothetical protein